MLRFLGVDEETDFATKPASLEGLEEDIMEASFFAL
jgi:hypothetical protein